MNKQIIPFVELYLGMARQTRQTGRTTALAEACKKIDGIFITQNESLCHMYKHKFGVKCSVPYERSIRGYRKPLVLDHYVLEYILGELLRYISEVELARSNLRINLIKLKQEYYILESLHKELKEKKSLWYRIKKSVRRIFSR